MDKKYGMWHVTRAISFRVTPDTSFEIIENTWESSGAPGLFADRALQFTPQNANLLHNKGR
ncbi:hypothetical protein [Hyphomonas sp. UBA3601]|uniref:hypothetical protein n=1 Tax=Hyphomonas sp. UBA3601 TaxID=1946626 RepID=UPI0025B9BC14|nr:hypothetical protein [Hyphomonas sp. UBA3601]